MLFPALVLIGTLVLMGALFYLLSRRIQRGTLRRPSGALSGFGIRIPSTLRSDEAWTLGHEAARPLISVIAVVCVASAGVALVILFARGANPAFAFALIAVLAVVGLTLAATVLAHRATQQGR